MKRLLLLLIVFIILVGCQTQNTNLSDKIIKAIDVNCNQESSCNIAVNEITDFKWDKMIIFDIGNSNLDISKALGTDYKDSVDLMSGIVFVYNDKIVYTEKFPYNPEKPNKLWVHIDNKSGEPNLWTFTPEAAIIEGNKTETDGNYYYEIKPANDNK